MVAQKKFIFLGGLPRSGSTLLCNILAQNPAIHATSTSGCHEVLFGIRNHWDKLVQHRSNPDREANQRAKLRVLRAVLNAYHDETDKPIVLDKSRGWLSLLEMLELLIGEKAKVIVPVRDVPDVLSSFEKLHRRQSALGQSPGEAENVIHFQTVDSRCEFWMRPDQPVGTALNKIHDALRRGFADRMHFVRFNDLTTRPQQTLAGIYAFLKLAPFDHNFSQVDQVTQEDDAVFGYDGLHTIRPAVESVPSDWREILGKAGERYLPISSIWNR